MLFLPENSRLPKPLLVMWGDGTVYLGRFKKTEPEDEQKLPRVPGGVWVNLTSAEL